MQNAKVEINLDEMLEEMGFGEYNELLDDSNHNLSTWIKDKDLFIPSTDISTVSKLPPGVYKISNTNDRGLHCKQLEVETDDLYVFTDSVIEDLLKQINLFWEHEDIYKKYNLVHKRGVLLSGYPGNGKTSLIDLISKELIKKEGVIFKIDDPSNFIDYLNFMKYGFKKIQPNTPIITILEDLESYVDVESRFLDFLDGQNQFSHNLVIATSNNTEEIPDSFLRPSRIDLRIEIDYPSETTRREFYEKKNISGDKLEHLVEETENCTFADLKEVFICHFVYNHNIKEAVERVKNPLKKKDYTVLNRKKSKLGF